MSNQADHTIVRLRVPPELKQKIEESAEKNNRSQSAEMVALMEKAFEIEALGMSSVQLNEAGSMFASGALLFMRTLLEKKLLEENDPIECDKIDVKISFLEELLEIFKIMGAHKEL